MKTLILVFAAATAAAAGVERDEFRYVRPLPDEVATGRVAFEPDGPMLAHTRPGLADLRIVDAQGSPVPWRRVPADVVGPEPARVLNSGRRGGQAVALVDVGPRRGVYERAELDIAGGNFVGRVTVLGSDRRAGPFTRLSTTTVFDVRGATAARSTTVVFPPTDFRFLELRASGVSRIDGATVFSEFERPQLVRRRLALRSLGARGGISTYRADLGIRGVPVTSLELRARQARYDRGVQIEGWSPERQRWTPVGGGRITRAPGLTSRRVAVASEFRYLRVRIRNGDDPPLEGVRIEAFGPSFAVMVEPGHRPPLRAYYGDRALPAPSYEFARLPVERPERVLDPSRLPAERLNPAFAVPGRPFGERHGWILTVALVAAALAVAAAGVLALRRRA